MPPSNSSLLFCVCVLGLRDGRQACCTGSSITYQVRGEHRDPDDRGQPAARVDPVVTDVLYIRHVLSPISLAKTAGYQSRSRRMMAPITRVPRRFGSGTRKRCRVDRVVVNWVSNFPLKTVSVFCVDTVTVTH